VGVLVRDVLVVVGGVGVAVLNVPVLMFVGVRLIVGVLRHFPSPYLEKCCEA
jgi:hypothetical protein